MPLVGLLLAFTLAMFWVVYSCFTDKVLKISQNYATGSNAILQMLAALCLCVMITNLLLCGEIYQIINHALVLFVCKPIYS